MNIVTLLEQLATTTHHKIDLDELLREKPASIKQAFANNDASSLKAFCNETNVVADRTTIFEL